MLGKRNKQMTEWMAGVTICAVLVVVSIQVDRGEREGNCSRHLFLSLELLRSLLSRPIFSIFTVKPRLSPSVCSRPLFREAAIFLWKECEEGGQTPPEQTDSIQATTGISAAERERTVSSRR